MMLPLCGELRWIPHLESLHSSNTIVCKIQREFLNPLETPLGMPQQATVFSAQ